jgi:chromosome segregation protein
MRLKKIEIFGFKSFAEKVVLDFNFGITGIVGPNGCGKSNISDAFRWVLGEQSAKSMRGAKMPDVIFAGTTGRKPLNFAEVTLTFSDIAGQLPTEYEEIAITRRLHRSKNGETAESDYFINRRQVRLKEIHDLFLDSGIGKNAFSIFEQGKIDQIIQFTPLERRYIFEEAAGILRFLSRKREALRKLEQTEFNIARVKDIHSEVEKQIAILQIQAEKAELYKENKKKLEQLELSLLFFKWNNFETKLSDLEQTANLSLSKLHEKNREMNGLVQNHREKKEAFSTKEKELLAKKEFLLKLESQNEILANEQRSNQERILELAAREKRIEESILANINKRLERERQSSQYLEQKKSIEAQLRDQETLLHKLRQKSAEFDEQVSRLRSDYQKNHQKQLKAIQDESTVRSDLKQQEGRLERTKERIRQLKIGQQQIVKQIEEHKKIINEKQSELQCVLEKIEKEKTSLLSLDGQIKQINDQILQTQKEQKEIHHLLTENRARHKILLRLREELEGFSSGTKQLLLESNNPKSPLFKKLRGLYEYLTPEKGFEMSLSLVMKPYAQTLVVQTEADLRFVIDYAKKNSLKDFSLISLERVEKGLKGRGKKKEKKIPQLNSVCSQNSLSEHFLSHIALADEIFSPDKSRGFEICSQNGFFIDSFDVIFYSQQGENNIFLREAEIKGIEEKLSEKESDKTRIDHLLSTLQQQQKQLLQNRQELDKAIRKEEMRLVEINFVIQRGKSDLERTEHQQTQLGKEVETTENLLSQLAASIQIFSEKLSAASEAANEIQKIASTLQSSIEQWTDSLKSNQKELREAEEEHQKYSKENQRLAHSLHLIEVQDKESLHEEKRLLQECSQGNELAASLKEKNSAIEERLSKAGLLLDKETKIKNSLEEELKSLQTVLEQSDQQTREQRHLLNQLEKEVNSQSIQRSQLESSKLGIESQLQERFDKTIEQVQKLELKLEKSIEQTEKQLRAVRQEIDSSDDINMASVEELDKHQVRYSFLNEQVTDLSQSKQELVKIIAELDKTSRKAFKDTFQAVRANFQKNFSILFEGGEADLQLTEAEDVLEAGIEIIAKPPGKQMRSITLLSGGEKCLTAIALLFAIFEVRPSPFCILDEVDAPLDESNVGRFANIVKQFVDRCQFIIITHNKRTMSIADVLFGISMEEKGISKVLSLEFAKN